LSATRQDQKTLPAAANRAFTVASPRPAVICCRRDILLRRPFYAALIQPRRQAVQLFLQPGLALKNPPKKPKKPPKKKH
jgi:hypothetical protein